MHNSRLLLVPFLLLTGLAANAQTELENLPEPIATDRPDQTETPTLVLPKHFQAELGLTFEQQNDSLSSIAHPNALLKYGLNENFELRLIIEPSTLRFNDKSESGLNPVAVGFKAALSEEKGILPKTSFIGHLSIPEAASDKFQALYFAPDFRFTMQNTLTENISLGYNLGAEWDGFGPEPTFIYTLSTAVGLTEKIGCYLEAYGFVPQESDTDHRIDGGFTYLIKNNVQVDLSGGFGLSKNSPDYFVSAGYSFRLKD